MKKVLASHQPNFFPYMGYLYKVFKSDIFVVSDNVCFTKRVYHNYTDIKTVHGKHRITVPVSSHSLPINEVKISATESDLISILRTIEQNYRNAKYFRDYFPKIKEIVTGGYETIDLINKESVMFACEVLGIEREFFLSSELDLKEKKDDRIIEMCKLFGANEYYSGTGAANYHIDENYMINGIKLTYTDYIAPTYRQLYGDFVGNLSCMDYIFNCGGKIPEGWCKNG